MWTIRRAAERIFRDRVVRRRLPASFGSLPMFMSAAGGLKMLFKPVDRIDPDLLRAAERFVRPGDVVWDIGANVGLFTMAAAFSSGRSGKVVSFEPDAELVPLLRRNAGLHPTLADIVVVNAAVAAQTGLRQFNIASRARASNALEGYGSATAGHAAQTQTVVALSVDDLLAWLPAPSVVKIDVEGAEAEIINTESALLTIIRPLILCEVSADNAKVIGATLDARDYAMFDGAQALSVNSRVTTPVFNTICIPRERENEWVA